MDVKIYNPIVKINISVFLINMLKVYTNSHPALVVTEGEVATNCYIYKYRYTPIILKNYKNSKKI